MNLLKNESDVIISTKTPLPNKKKVSTSSKDLMVMESKEPALDEEYEKLQDLIIAEVVGSGLLMPNE